MEDNKPFLVKKLIDFWYGNIEPSEIFWTANIFFAVLTILDEGLVTGLQLFSCIAMIYAFFLGLDKLIKSIS